MDNKFNIDKLILNHANKNGLYNTQYGGNNKFNIKQKIEDKHISKCIISNNGEKLVFSSGRYLNVRNIQDGIYSRKKISQIWENVKTLSGHSNKVSEVAVFADGDIYPIPLSARTALEQAAI